MIWKSRLGWKLFSVLMLNALIIIGVMAGAFQLSISQDFENLVREQARDRLEQLARTLGQAYRVEGSWEGVLRRPELRGLFMMQPSSPPLYSSKKKKDDDDEEDDDDDYKDRRRRIRPPRVMHISLFDQKDHLLMGPLLPLESISVPITVAGEDVGRLAGSIHLRGSDTRESLFLERQMLLMWVLAGSMAVMALLVAFGVSAYLLRPIRSLAGGTRAIAERNFTVRLEPYGKDELGQLARDFNAMAADLESFEEERRRWIADTSHELGTPLAVLRGEIEALQDGIREPTPERLTSLHHEVVHLTRLVEDLKLISRAEAGRLELNLRPVELKGLLEETVQRFEARLQQKGLQLQLQATPDLYVSGDSERLEQVLGNLLENVLRYADAPGTVRLSCEAAGDQVRCRVEDSGPGVPAELLSQLFDRFFRAEGSRNRATGGSGLGLAICKNLIEAHGGRISAQPSALGGLCIDLQLPHKPPT